MIRSFDSLDDAIRDTLFTPLNLNGAIRTEEVTVQFENNSQADTDLRNVRPGDGSVSFSGGAFTVATDADGSDAQAIETASIGEYAAGLPAAIGQQIQKESDPVGVAEWGYGGDAFDDELRWHLESDGTYAFERETGGVTTTIDQTLWDSGVSQEPVTDENGDATGVVTGRDPLDGTGDSGADIATPVLGLFGVDFVLYGGGGFAPWFVDLTTRGTVEKLYPFVFHPTAENVLTQFNQPVFARLSNDGTAEADSMRVTERQFSHFGTNAAPERGTPHCFDLTKTVSSPTCLVAVRRADAGGGTRLDLSDVAISVDTDAHVWFIVAPDVTSGGASGNWTQPVQDFAGSTVAESETAVEVNESLTVDASTGIAFDGSVVEGTSGGGVPGASAAPNTTSFRSSPFIRDRPVAVMGEPVAGGSDVTSQQGIVTVTEGF
jgi:hypothetical protein